MRLVLEIACDDVSHMASALQTKALLEAMEGEFDLEPYIFTERVLIRPLTVPHSHPVLTLHTLYRNDRNRLLSCFLHEQIHWHCAKKKAETQLAMSELRKIFQQVPSGPGSVGAKDEESTYLHLVVNFLELQALEIYLGEKTAKGIIRSKHVYTWIYETVLSFEKEIADVVSRCGLLISPGAARKSPTE